MAATDVEKLIAEILGKHSRAEQVGALCGAGEDLLGAEDLTSAMACFDRGLKVDPRSTRSWVGRAKVLTQRGRQGEALGCLDRALDVDPHDSRALVTKADVLLKMGLRDEALACYDRATASAPDDAHVWINRGRMLEEMKRAQDALDAYEKALAIVESPTLRARQANLFIEMGRTASAVKCLERAAESEPDNAEWWFRLGLAHGNLRADSAARVALERYLALAPKGPHATQVRTILGQIARHAPAETTKKESAPLDADEEAEEVAFLQSSDGSYGPPDDDWLVDPQPRRDHGGDASPRGPAESDPVDEPEGSRDSMLEEVQTLLLLKRNVEALRILDVLAKDNDDVEVFVARARALNAVGEHDAAVLSSERAVELDPGHVEAQHVLGRTLLDAKSDVRALDVAERLLAVRATDAEAHRTRGRALVALTRHLEGAYAFEKAVLYAPQDAESWFLLGRTLRLLRRFDAARDALTKARGFAKATRLELVAPIEALLEKLA